jgi:hypothetical protein
LKKIFYVGETRNAYKNFVGRYEGRTLGNPVSRGDDIIKLCLKNYNERVLAGAPTEDESADSKNNSQEKTGQIFNQFTKYPTNILITDCIAKSETENIL